jgi:hypothetical protein
MAGAVLSTPSESSAFFCCNWLFGGHGCHRTTYRPLFSGLGCCAAPAPVCNPCQTQTCNYVPQTCYRPECVNVPVTTYRQVCTTDPCTGCPVTALKPCTTMVRQVRYVPYTTYRQVCTTNYAPAALPVTSHFATTIQANAAPAANCCTPAATPFAAPGTTYSTPTVIQGAPAVQGTPVIPATPAPALQALPATPQAYESKSTTQPYQELKIVPQQNGGAGDHHDSHPLLRDPHSRTTSLPRATHASAETLVVPALYTRPAAEAESIDDGGWRAARR